MAGPGLAADVAASLGARLAERRDNVPVDPIGPKLAEGRDSEIFEHGPDRVLRVARDGRSLAQEAETMSYARDHGYPCPAVHDAGDGYLVMDRLVGPTMMEAAGRPPSRSARWAACSAIFTNSCTALLRRPGSMSLRSRVTACSIVICTR
ncbi:MAG: hypothetical protein R2710_27705 [Acidimicrobiales bacterium]